MIRALRVLYALAVAAVILALPLPAQALTPAAADFDCKESPVAEMPGGGTAGWWGTPDKVPADPENGAWRNGAPIYENYGMAGLTFHNYDLGCGADIAQAPGAVVGTPIANWTLEGVKFAVAGTVALTDAAYNPTYLQAFNPVLSNATETLRRAIFDQWVPLTIVLVGLMLMWRSARMQWSATAGVVAWALLVMVIASAVFAWPIKAGSAADETVGSVLGGVHAGINGQGAKADPANQVGGALSNAVLFEQWKMGTFGRGNSATAQKYAKAIYTNQALTWAEAALVRADPDGAGKELLDRKAEAWGDAAEEIKDADPDAYLYLTGHKAETRIGAALVSGVAMLCALPFLLASSLLLIGAYLIIRLAVVFFPLIATIGIAHPFRGAVKGVGTVVAAALLNSIMFGVGTAVTLLVTRILLSPESRLPLWLALALMFVFSIIMWYALKPMRKLTSMASPNNVFKDAASAVGDISESAKDTVAQTAKTAAAVYTGVHLPAANDGDWAEGEGSSGKYRGQGVGERTETQSVPVPTATHPPVTERELPSAADRAPIEGVAITPPPPLPGGAPVETSTPTYVSSTVVGSHRAETPHDAVALPPGPSVDVDMSQPVQDGIVSTPDLTVPAPEAAVTDTPVFHPGGPVVEGPADLPSATAPSIDAETGESVYELFVPEEAEVGDEPRQ